MSLSSLDSLLIRIQAKIESRTRRPWFDLQRSYYFKDANGIKNANDLRRSLEHFHVLLSDDDIYLLFDSFPHTAGGFDFKAFAARLYPKEYVHRPIRDGRFIEDTTFRQTGANIINAEAEQYAPGQYEQKDEFHQQAQATELDYPRLGDTIPDNQYGTTQYYTQPTKKQIKQTTVDGIPKKKSSYIAPRITYNRPHHARFNEYHTEEYYGTEPKPQIYPQQEFQQHGQYSSTLDKPRFDTKKVAPLVEVARRHNISRQYNRPK